MCVRLVVGICALAALGLAPAAQAAPGEYDLPVHIIVETFALPGPNDKDRCLGASSVEFPEIPNAKGYRVITKDVKYGAGTMDQVGPPFPADHRVYGPAHWDAPARFHRFALSAASTGQGCAQVILGLEKQWQIVSAKVSMNKRFQKRADEVRDEDVPKVCAIEGNDEHVKLKGATKTIIKRSGGRIWVTYEWSAVRQRVTTGAVAGPGTIVETGKDSWIQIADTSGGESFVLGPHVKIRVTSSGFDILERPRRPPPPPKYWIEHYFYEDSVRTCSGWAPRG
jgi:hypothetical protein